MTEAHTTSLTKRSLSLRSRLFLSSRYLDADDDGLVS